MFLVHPNSGLRSGYVELGSPCGCPPVDLQPPINWASAPAWRPPPTSTLEYRPATPGYRLDSSPVELILDRGGGVQREHEHCCN